jgi:PST family polysaccharide transporter
MSSDEQFDTAHLHQNLSRLAVQGGLALLVGQGIQLLLSITSTIILARLLVPEDFGLVAMVAPFIGFIAFFRDSGLHMATIQQETINHKQISTLFWFNLGMGFVLMLLLGLLSPAVARFFGRDELLWITLAYSINMLIGSASIQHSALLTRQMAFGKLTAIGIASQTLGIVTAVIIAWYGLGYWALIVMAITTTVSQTILIWLSSGWVPGLPQRNTGVRKMLAFGGGLTISNLFNQATQHIDSILIGRMLGASLLGFYDRAKQLFLMPLMQLIGPLNNVSIPTLSRLTNTPEKYKQTYLRIQEKMLILTALFSAFLVVYGDLIILFLLGPQWSFSGPILQALAVGGLIIPVSSSVSWLLVTQARSRDLAHWAPFSLIFRCVAILCGYPWGILGIAISIAIFQFLSFISFGIWVGRKGPLTAIMVFKNMTPALVAALISCSASYLTKMALEEHSSILSLGVGAVVSGLIFFIVLWMIPQGKSALLDMRSMAKMVLARA